MSNKKTALITGILGQDGPYLAKLLLDKDYKVYGLLRNKSDANFSNLDCLGLTDRIKYIEADITNEAGLNKLVSKIKPDEIYNLAAQSYGGSWDKTKVTTEVNSLGVLNILEAIRFLTPETKFFQASSSEMYGAGFTKSVKTEKTPFRPRNPYAISKLYAHWMTVNYREHFNLFCANGILFNHESPIRGHEFVTRKISDGVAKIKLGLSNEIRLGNLESKRDWGFAGDYVEAMWLMLQQEKADDYIISTGKTHSIREFLEVAFNRVGIKNWKKYIKIDPRFKRPREFSPPEGRSDKARKELSWKPKVRFEELVKMMVDSDIEHNRLLQK